MVHREGKVEEGMGYHIGIRSTKHERERNLVCATACAPFADGVRPRLSKEEFVMRSVAILLMLICAVCLSGGAGGGSGPAGR